MTDQIFQIGFLTEWQMYAQKIEGDSWRGDRLDKGKIDKMSGNHAFQKLRNLLILFDRSAAWADV